MKKLIVLAAISLSACAAQTAPQPVNPDVAKFQQRAQGITIIRDDWGCRTSTARPTPTRCSALIYAQAEDDFNRVETNYHQLAWAGSPRPRARRRSGATCA